MRLENFWIFTKSDKVHTGFLRSSSTNTIIPFRLLCKLKAVEMLNGRDINKVLLPVLNASYVAVVGTITRTTASSVNGTTTTLTTATTILASAWPCAPDEKCTSVSCPTKYIRVFCWASSFLLKQKTSLLCGTTDIRVRIDGEFRIRLPKRRYCMEPAASVPLLKCLLEIDGVDTRS